MYLPLVTVDVWEITGNFAPNQFFRSLSLVSAPDDILIIGSYWVEHDTVKALKAMAIDLPISEIPFQDTFDLNRKEYPEGRFYACYPTSAHLEKLGLLSEVPKGGVEKDLFFDHVLMYRQGNPLLPLLYFHDAFIGGTLYLSGHYSKEVIQSFSVHLGATGQLVDNPDLRKEQPWGNVVSDIDDPLK